MKKYPFVKQDDLKDCGVSTLLMIIKYYKGNISKEKLREMTKTNKFGTTAYYIIEAAKDLGFESQGIRCNIKKLGNIKLPCIAHVTINDSYKHYVVIYKIDYKKNEVLVADPSYKLKKIKFSDFDKIFNNIVITFKKIKNIPIYYKEKNFVQFLIQIIIKYKTRLFLILLLSIFITFFSIISSFYFKILLMNKKNLFNLFIIFLFVECIKNISILIRNNILIYINKNITQHLFMDIFKRIILLPYNYYRNRTSGEIISRINDITVVREATNEILVTVFIDLILSISTSIILFSISKLLFLISILILVFYILIVIIFKPIFINKITKLKNDNATVNSYMVESITGFETVKGLNITNSIITNMKYKYKNYIDKISNLDGINNIENFLKNIFNDIGNIIIIFIGIKLYLEKTLSFTSLITFIFILSYFLEPIKNIISLQKKIYESKSSFKRIYEIINFDFKNKRKLDNINEIEIRKLNYITDNDNHILKNINLKINKKDKIAIIGESGSGKSTLLKLIKNYYESSNIYVNDNKLNEIQTDDIVYISQNEILFTDTLYNNITLFKEINENDFFKVLKTCYIDDILKNNNLGYYMYIEENGFNISGGEKQRIALARALLTKSNYIIIDEGLSQVDIKLERKILKNIMKNYKNKTIIFVSHRKDNLELFDRLIEINNGNLIERLC